MFPQIQVLLSSNNALEIHIYNWDCKRFFSRGKKVANPSDSARFTES